MKRILLSADDDIKLYAVPDEVADDLDSYCHEFCCVWLRESPDAAKYRTMVGNSVGYMYSDSDFIEYLNKYVCEEKSELLQVFTGKYDLDEIPEEYRQLPYFWF